MATAGDISGLNFPSAADLKIEPGVRLQDYTTFRLGGAAGAVLSCHRPETLCAVSRTLADGSTPWVIIGAGSNLLVADSGFDGVVVRFFGGGSDIRREGNTLVVSGAAALDAVVRCAVELGLEGLVFASGIPGTVGAAVAGNSGAFGGDGVLEWADVFFPERGGEPQRMTARDIDLAYRYSRLPADGGIVVRAAFALRPGEREGLAAQRKRILAERSLHQPDIGRTPCAGSFFRNPEGLSAARLIEAAGVRNIRRGGAAVSREHANILVKVDEECRAQDVIELALDIYSAVKRRFGVGLLPEVKLVGDFGDVGIPPAWRSRANGPVCGG